MLLRTVIIMALTGAAVGMIVGTLWKVIRTRPYIRVALCLGSGLFIETVAQAVARGNMSAAFTYMVISWTVATIVLALVVFFSDDDWRKRFFKKSSEKLRSLLAKVREATRPPIPA